MIGKNVIRVSETHVYVDGSYVKEPMNNQLFEEGFLYSVKGDFTITNNLDKDGLPIYESYVHFFKRKEEAEEYASKQKHPFYYDQTVRVEEVVHKETLEEYRARVDKKKAEKQAKKIARDSKKAEQLGISLKQFSRIQYLRRKLPKIDIEIKSFETALHKKEEEKEAILEELKQLAGLCKAPIESVFNRKGESKGDI